MENCYDDEFLQFVNPLLNALQEYILQKQKVADDRGLWDLLKEFAASIVEKVTTWITNTAEFVKRLVSRGRKLVEDIVNKMSVLISSIKSGLVSSFSAPRK
ncbi:hypothetical protein LINGRAHAP2_LOCUS24777 [Linum grandiflorum]